MILLYALAIIAYLVGGFFFIKYKLWRPPFWLIRMKLNHVPIRNPQGGTFGTYQEFFKSPVTNGMATFWSLLWPIVATFHILATLIFGLGYLLMIMIVLLLSLVFKNFSAFITWPGKMLKSLANVNGH